MLQFLPALILLLLQSAPADRAAFVMDWAARQSLSAEHLPTPVTETEVAPALTSLAFKSAPVERTKILARKAVLFEGKPTAKLTAGFEGGSRQRDGPHGC